MPNPLHALVTALPNLLAAALPCPCALCGTEQAHSVCAACEHTLLAPQTRCQCCAIPLPYSSAERCGACLSQPPSYQRTITLGDYSYPAQRLVLGLKFGAQLPLARYLGQQLANATRQAVPPLLPLPELLIPIPLHPLRLRERGFNQAWEITRILARELQIPARADVLQRVLLHPAQASLSLKERQKNLRRAFAITDNAAVRGKHIGLVDDVMTTGTTVEEAARTLLRSGAASVTNFVALRTPH